MGTPYFYMIDIVQEINCLTYNLGYIFMEFNLQHTKRGINVKIITFELYW